ncbi:phage major capsid protein [Mycobacterium sp. JS623]|uniref:phage major capsid protein n=1 Tax=Mycobacterium sp. JS623 TaxID=212767 RepID=UPI001E5E8835|nr:phage major capsid protein [Mycobacterium sp. JS623]
MALTHMQRKQQLNMNESQIEAVRRQINEEAAELDQQIGQAIATKSFGTLPGLEARVEKLAASRAELDAAEVRAKAFAAHPLAGAGMFAASVADDEHRADAPADNLRLAFNAKMAKGLVERKSLAASGAAVVGQEFLPDPIALGQPATGLLDVLPTVGHGSPLYAFLQQSTRTNNAAVVASGAVKPTSVYSVTRVEQSLSVIAHLSEGIDHYWMADNATLEQFISGELNYGLQRAVEAKVLADINATSGIVTQAFATSIPVTLRKSLTALEVAGYTASAIVLHPSDFEAIELLLSTTNAVEHLSLPYNPAQRRLYGVPIATTISQAAGVGHVLARNAVAVDTDHLGVQLTWSEMSNADDFSRNLNRARLEGRYGTSVYLPGGVVKATLASS